MRLTFGTPARLLLLASPLLGACDEAASIDRRAVYGEIATNVIAPSYADLRADTAALAAAATAFCADTSSASAFEAVRTAYLEAQNAYQHTTALELGSSPPVLALAPVYLHTFPVATTTGATTSIDAILADTSALDFSAQPASVQGLFAVEYLLHSAADANATRALYQDAGTGPRRCDYLTALTQRIATVADGAADAWDPPGPNSFGNALTNAGSVPPYATVGAATTAFMQRLYVLAHDLADYRLGRPLGLVASGTPTPNPTAAPGHLANTTKADLLAALDGIENVYLGRFGATDGRGLEDIVRSRSVARDTEFKTALAEARAAIVAIPGDVDVAVADSASVEYAAVLHAFDELKTLQTLLGTGIGPLLGVSSAAFETDND